MEGSTSGGISTKRFCPQISADLFYPLIALIDFIHGLTQISADLFYPLIARINFVHRLTQITQKRQTVSSKTPENKGV